MGGCRRFWEECGGHGENGRVPEVLGGVRRAQGYGSVLEVLGGVRRVSDGWGGSGGFGRSAEGCSGMGGLQRFWEECGGFRRDVRVLEVEGGCADPVSHSILPPRCSRVLWCSQVVVAISSL